MTTWEDNANRFADLDTGEGWPFALLVACSVELRGHGGDRRSSNSHYLKASAAAFAEQAGTSSPRVSRFLDTWHKAADQGLVRPAAELTPADALTEPLPNVEWKTFYAAPSTRGSSKVDNVVARAERDPEYARELREAVAPASPEEKRAEFTRLAADDDVRDDHQTRHAANESLGDNSTVRRLKASGHRKQEQTDAALEQHPLKQVQAQGYVSMAARQLEKAVAELETTRITDTEVADLMRENVAQVERNLDLVKMSLDGTSDAVEEAIAQLGENTDG